MARQLDIPYRSQSDSDALYAATDCGAACVAMLLEAFGMNITIDDIFKSTGRKQSEFLSRTDLVRAANKHLLKLEKFQGGNKNFLIDAIDDNRPFIALVNYAAWSESGSGVVTMSDFAKTHFVVVTGYDGNDVFINDPLWWGVRRLDGKDKKMTYDQFAEAWGRCHQFNSNPDFVGIITKDPLPGHAQPVGGPPVSQQEINRILAWAAFMDIAVDETILTTRDVADVFLTIMGDWGTVNVIDHTIAPGDDLGILALRYYDNPMKWKVIAKFNNLPPLDAFSVGDVLRIPEPTR